MCKMKQAKKDVLYYTAEVSESCFNAFAVP